MPLQGRPAEEIAIGANGDLYVSSHTNAVLTSNASSQKKTPCTIPENPWSTSPENQVEEVISQGKKLFDLCLADEYCKSKIDQNMGEISPELAEMLREKREYLKKKEEQLKEKKKELKAAEE